MKLKIQYDETLRRINKKLISKNRANSGFNFCNKRILNNLYSEKMDDEVEYIMGELYNLFGKLTSASMHVSAIFSPGIKHLYCCAEEFNIEGIHKEQFSSIFLNDDFLKVI